MCVTPASLQVKGLEFNSFSPNLLASGAADGELCIWDVANPAQPSLYPALKVRCTRPRLGVLLLLNGLSAVAAATAACTARFAVRHGRSWLGQDTLSALVCLECSASYSEACRLRVHVLPVRAATCLCTASLLCPAGPSSSRSRPSAGDHMCCMEQEGAAHPGLHTGAGAN